MGDSGVANVLVDYWGAYDYCGCALLVRPIVVPCLRAVRLRPNLAPDLRGLFLLPTSAPHLCVLPPRPGVVP